MEAAAFADSMMIGRRRRQAANTIPLFGRELRELFVPGCWLRTPVVANHLREEIPLGSLPAERYGHRTQEFACRFVPRGRTAVDVNAMKVRRRLKNTHSRTQDWMSHGCGTTHRRPERRIPTARPIPSIPATRKPARPRTG